MTYVQISVDLMAFIPAIKNLEPDAVPIKWTYSMNSANVRASENPQRKKRIKNPRVIT